jgi:DNA polymerase III subunit beta
MTISFNKETILEKLSFSSRFTSSKLSSISALQGVLIKGDGEHIHFYSTNLNAYYHTKIISNSKKEFSIIVEPRKIMEFLTLLSPGSVDIEITEKQIIISQKKTRGEFPLITSEDFPLPPKLEEKRIVQKSDFFLNKVPLVIFSASSDESRPVLTGVNFVSQENDFLIVATDGFRLSLLKTKKENDFPSVIVPSGFLAEVIQALKGQKEVHYCYSEKEKLIGFYIGEHELFSRLIEGDYPPFSKVIPTEKNTEVVADREELIKNIKLASIFAREFSNIVIVHVSNEGLHVEPKTEVKGNTSFQEIEFKGDEQRVAFNYKFLLDFLNHISSKKIIIELLRPDAPAVFKPEGEKDYIHIIMPVRIQE